MGQMWSNHQKMTSHRLFLDLRNMLAQNQDVTGYSRGAGHDAHGNRPPSARLRSLAQEGRY